MEAKEIGPQLEESFYTNGLVALRKQLGSDNLLTFPTRPNGTALLLRQSFYERMFNGTLDFLDFQASDVNAAQVDLKNLDLPQLLFIRCENLDFQASSAALKSQAEFLATVQSMIEKRISERLVLGGGRAWGDASRIGEITRSVLLAYGVHAVLGEEQGRSELWLLRLGTLEALLHLPSCELRRLQASEDQLSWCHRNLSLSSATVPKEKKKLHWQVELTDKPAEFKDEKKSSAAAEERRARIGSAREGRLAASGPRTDMMGEKKLQETLERASVEVNRLKKELEESKQEVVRARESGGTATDFEAKLRQDLDTLKRSLAEKAKECEGAVPERERLQEELTSVKSKLEQKCKECEETGPELERLQQELSAVKSALEEKPSEFTEAAAEREKLQEEIASVKSELELKCQKCDEAGTQLEKLQQELSTVSRALEAAEEKNQTPLPELDTKNALEEARQRLAETEARLAEQAGEFESELSRRDASIADLQKRLDEARELEAELSRRDASIADLQKQLTEAREFGSELSRRDASIADLQKQLDEAVREPEKLQEELSSVKSVLEQKMKQCHEAEPELERLRQDALTATVALEKKTCECAQAAKEKDKFRDELTSVKGLLEQKMKQCQEAEPELERLRQDVLTVTGALEKKTCECAQAATEQDKFRDELTSVKGLLEQKSKECEEREPELQRLQQEISTARSALEETAMEGEEVSRLRAAAEDENASLRKELTTTREASQLRAAPKDENDSLRKELKTTKEVREAEKEGAVKAEHSRIVKGRVASVSEMREKGHFLVDVMYILIDAMEGEEHDEETARVIVVDREVSVGKMVTIALEGAKLPNGEVAKRREVAGEWSDGELLDVIADDEPANVPDDFQSVDSESST